jgi:hypothetical protein
VLETEHEQDEDQADLGARLDETPGRDQREDASLAEREARDQIERNRGQVESRRDACEDREPEDHGAELQEPHCGQPRVVMPIERV